MIITVMKKQRSIDLDEEYVTKYCHESGYWAGQSEGDFSNPSGWTNYFVCMLIDSDVIEKAQSVARSARKLEFVGLALSFLSLIIAITIFTAYRRLRVFRNQVHVQLMLAILLTVVIRLMIYIDQIFTENISRSQLSDDGYTINTVRFVCELFYALLEYGKTVAFAWMFIEGFYLHNLVVVQVFEGKPKLWKYLIIGWGIPIFHVLIWLTVIVAKRGAANVERLHALHTRKSVRAAAMLIPLLGIPNIMQTIPFTPSKDNIGLFQVFTYIASFFYMFQGFMVAVMYCFTNREVSSEHHCV
ncbi:unnamed protein product [Soboliphyme baturini]|uniref:G_PROTEIN_RECEP_F2_4 domain-containing protein n=1 Tax=Soboliphyme baturini TaxID=241478 RepID=A0A183IGR7_9BILA|nr:unnamed protein product [Soboliphyme baturini]